MTKRIIHFVDSSAIGGIETHIHLISKHLKRHNYDVSVLFFNDYGDHPLESKFKHDHISYTKLNGSIWNTFKYLKKNKPSILHTHGYKAGIIGKILGLILKIKIISTYHSGDLGTGTVKYYSKIDESLSRLCLPLSVSKEIQNRIPVSSILVKNSVEIPTKTIQTNKYKNIGFVGRLSHEKAPDIFLDISRCFPELTFHLYGDGEMRIKLKEKAPKNLIFHGFCSDMTKVWNSIDLLIMPSRQEGLPLAALEAMSHDIPLIASNVGDLPALITHKKNGYICEKENIDHFCHALHQWLKLSNKKKNTLSKNAFNKINDEYNIQNEIQNLISLYQTQIHIREPKQILKRKKNALSS